MKIGGRIYSLGAEDTQQTHKPKFNLVRGMSMDIGSLSRHLKGNIRDETSGGMGFFEAI